jgi:hypothetical protein
MSPRASRDASDGRRGCHGRNRCRFLGVCVALAFGHLPGFKVDRTGAAVIGALAMTTLGEISPQAAWAALIA